MTIRCRGKSVKNIDLMNSSISNIIDITGIWSINVKREGDSKT